MCAVALVQHQLANAHQWNSIVSNGVCLVNAKARAIMKKIRSAHKLYTGWRYRSVHVDDDDDDYNDDCDGLNCGQNASCKLVHALHLKEKSQS